MPLYCDLIFEQPLWIPIQSFIAFSSSYLVPCDLFFAAPFLSSATVVPGNTKPYLKHGKLRTEDSRSLHGSFPGMQNTIMTEEQLLALHFSAEIEGQQRRLARQNGRGGGCRDAQQPVPRPAAIPRGGALERGKGHE
jgi:hypothetical protein